MDTWSATALNTAPDSENRIHSDELAQQYGFEGGLVPGVTISAYLVHPLVERWGKAGSIEGTQIVASPLRCMTESCSTSQLILLTTQARAQRWSVATALSVRTQRWESLICCHRHQSSGKTSRLNRTTKHPMRAKQSGNNCKRKVAGRLIILGLMKTQ